MLPRNRDRRAPPRHGQHRARLRADACWPAGARSLAVAALLLAGCGELAPVQDEPNVAKTHFRAVPEGFEIRRPGADWAPFWINGINYGHALPGDSPGEFNADAETIAGYIEAAAELGVNTLRIYTVQSPDFYRALRAWNLAHPARPLYLMQGVWLKEPELLPHDYLGPESETWFRDEIDKVIDVVHGEREIPPGSDAFPDNYGRAFGTFDADVSPWLLAWLIGREVEPYTIQSSNEVHWKEPVVDYQGRYLGITGVGPMEAFCVEHMDLLMQLEQDRYGTQHPIGWSNWPTLDPLTHPTEPGLPVSVEDTFELDMAGVQVDPSWAAGFYASYHAYPYYPDFILHQPSYQDADDGIGPNTYLGYLQELRAHYATMPLIVGEVGHPSSWGNAHQTVSGLDHGGLNEREQGEAVLRSVRTVEMAGLDGAVVFALKDEWFKKAWVVERVELPAERRKMWFNTMNPEQNFGLLALRPDTAADAHILDGVATSPTEWPSPQLQGDAELSAPAQDGQDDARRIKDVTVDHDAGFLHVRIRFADLDPDGDGAIDWARWRLRVLFDVIDANRGEGRLQAIGPDTSEDGADDTAVGDTIKLARRAEFMLRVDGPDDAALMVDQPFDLYGLWHNLREPWQLWRSEANDDGGWHDIRTITNFEYGWTNPATGEEELLGARREQHTGRMRVGHEDEDSLAAIAFDVATSTVEIRVPWGLLSFTDPSQRLVVDGEDPAQPARVTPTETAGVGVAVVTMQRDPSTTAVKLADAVPNATFGGAGGKIDWTVGDEDATTGSRGWLWYSWQPWGTKSQPAKPAYHVRRKKSFDIFRDGIMAVVPPAAAYPSDGPLGP